MFNEFQPRRSTFQRDSDSLAEESLSQRLQDEEDNVSDPRLNNNNNNNGYDFLIDEEYQELKSKQENLQIAQWLIMAQKVGLSFIMKEVYSQVQEQSLLLNEGANSTTVMRQKAKSSFRNLKEGQAWVKKQLSSNQGKIQELIEDFQHLQKLLAQEQDKTHFLEQQLTIRRQSATTDTQKDEYIRELEMQLQDLRKALLEKGLKLSDKEEEAASLRKQLQNMDMSFNQLEEQKREIDELVIKVSQELRSKEYDMRDYNYQIASEKELLARQIDLLKKELQEEKERKQALEMLESDLIHKAEVKENENQQIRMYQREIEEKLHVKTEAIEKAQKIIEKLNEEFEKCQAALAETEGERDQYRQESKDASKRVIDLQRQLQQLQTSHQINQQQVSAQLKTEIDELKDALRQYQQQFDDEKRSLQLTLREANEDKYKIHIEKEKQEALMRKQIAQLYQKIEDDSKLYQQKIMQIEKEFKEEKDAFEQQHATREESAQSQIKYLQKRLIDIANETQLKTSTQPNATTGKTSYLLLLRQEFEVISNQMLEIQGAIKDHYSENSLLQLQTQFFEEFKVKVLDQLSSWELKAEGIAQLTQRYEKELDEQKRLFMGMRQLLKEKDSFISQVQKLAKARELASFNHVQRIKEELEKQTYLVKIDIIDQLKAIQVNSNALNDENLDLEKRFYSFKQEYMQTLEDRDAYHSKNIQLNQDYEQLLSNFNLIKQDHQSFQDQVQKTMLPFQTSYSSYPNSTQTILDQLQKDYQELEKSRQDLHRLNKHLKSLENQQQEDKTFMQSKVQAVEDQLLTIQRQNLSKEEEMQIQFLQKETKYVNEQQRLQQELGSLQNQVQIRERQIKKIQDQQDEKLVMLEELEKQLESTARERMSLEGLHKQTLEEIKKMEKYMQETELKLEKQVTLTCQVEGEKNRAEDRERYLREAVSQIENELQRERDLNLQLQEEKYQVINQSEANQEKLTILERENSNLYKELVTLKETIKDISLAYDLADKEKKHLQEACSQLNNLVSQLQGEIQASQRDLQTLSSALDATRKKYQKTKQLKIQIRLLVENEKQLNEIIEKQNRYLNVQKRTTEVQTNDSGIQEIQFYQEQMLHFQRQNQQVLHEIDNLQEIIARNNQEVNRLIEEKRDLEDLVDQQNQSIKQIRLTNNTANNLHVNSSTHQMKENVNSINLSNQKISGNDLYSQILQEKENYIMRLESEMSEMRREIDMLKEKLIQYEIGNLSFDRSINQYQKSSNYQQYASQGQKGAGQLQQKGIIPFKANQTYQNSLNFSNYYNATQTTNHHTLQQPAYEVAENYKTISRSNF